MIFRTFTVLSLMFFLTAPSLALGQDAMIPGRPYFNISGLMFIPEDGTIDSSTEVDPSNAVLEMDVGFGFILAAGIKLESGLRGELEYSFRNTDMDRIVGPNLATSVQGDIDTNAIMFNALYDFQTASSFYPYLGFGLGFAFHNVSLTSRGGTPLALPEESDTVFAAQLMAGMGREISENMDMGVGYRFFHTGAAEVSFISASYDTHNIEVFLKYFFY